MLNEEEKEIVINIINEALNKAEKHWENGGYEIILEDSIVGNESKRTTESEKSNLPGHEIVHDNETKIATFIALVMDMRDSSKHLMEAISHKNSKVTELQRVYYETSALLPAIAQTIKFKEGHVTEYLGDGLLAFFKCNEEEPKEDIYKAYKVAKNIINDTRIILNNILFERYCLPEINLGVGLACSKTLITLIGLEHEKHPKAFGKCVFRATKLSSGINEICVDEVLKDMWPSTQRGTLNFKETNKSNVKGYIVKTH